MSADTPWKPPTAGGDPDAPFLPPATGPADSPAAPAAPAGPSPWSPEGEAARSRHGEPAVPTVPAAEPAPSTSAWSQPGEVPAGAPPAPSAPADVVAEPEPSRRRRSKLVVGGAVAAVAAVGLAGLFAVDRFGDAAIGGSPTADQLGLDLMSALESEDVLGIIDTMLPGERDSLGEPFVELVAELQRLEILAPDTDLSSLAGLDIELDGETVRVEATNVPDIVNVHLSADALVTVDGAALPIGALVEDRIPDEALVELRNTRLAESEPFDLELTAVLEGDTWYFSLFHTLAETLRQDAGLTAIPTAGLPLLGAETPEGAVDGLLDQVERLDLTGIIGMLDPFEAQALQRYAPLFVGDAQAMLDEIPLTWRIDVRNFRVEGDGDERTVFVDALGIAGEIDGAPFTVRFEGDCVRAQLDGEVIDQCASTGPGVDEMFGGIPALDDFVTALEDAFADMEPVGLELRRRDDVWYVSPLATGTDALLAALRALDRSEIDLLVDRGEDVAAGLSEMFLGGLGLGMGDDMIAVPDATFDDVVVGTVPQATSIWEQCYSEVDAGAAADCFGAAVAAGELTETDVPVYLRFPECGLAEASWSGDLYGLDDATFVAIVEPAVACFDGLVRAGTIEWWEVPYEVTSFPCFENRNWYTEFDDDAYNARVEACTFELSRSGE